MRRLSVKKRGRSASIAVPGASCPTESDVRCGAEEDPDDEDVGASEEKPARGMLTRTHSARWYKSTTGSVRTWTAADLEDISADSWQSYYLRCFSVTSKGVVSRGDYVRYRRVGIPSIHEIPSQVTGRKPSSSGPANGAPVQEERGNATVAKSPSTESFLGIEEFTVYLMGASGVGKTALTQQFTTSEHILNSKTKDTSIEETMVTISLDGEESRLIFKEISNVSLIEPISEESSPCAFLVVYSVTQAESFSAAACILCQLLRRQSVGSHEESVIILVGNKSDLVRSRSVDSEEGLSLATNYKIKFIETSVGINYNVDELLVGVLTHLRVLNNRRGESSRQLSKRNRFSGARSSIRRIIRRVLKKDEPQSSNCDIFKVL